MLSSAIHDDSLKQKGILMNDSKRVLFALAGFSLLGMSAPASAKTNGSISTLKHRQAEYPKMALINSSDAVKAATDKVPGDILSVALENEDGSLVYAVEVVNAQTGLHEVNVDAGNGKILSNEEKDHDHREPSGEEEDD